MNLISGTEAPPLFNFHCTYLQRYNFILFHKLCQAWVLYVYFNFNITVTIQDLIVLDKVSSCLHE